MAHKIMSQHLLSTMKPMACNRLHVIKICDTMLKRVMLTHGVAAD